MTDQPYSEEDDGASDRRGDQEFLLKEEGGYGNGYERLEIEKGAKLRGRYDLERVEPEDVGESGTKDAEK